MKWRFRFEGESRYFIVAILFSVLITGCFIGFVFLQYKTYVLTIDNKNDTEMGYFAIAFLFFFLFFAMVYALSWSNWAFERFHISSDGIELKKPVGKRLVRWENIEKAAIYTVTPGLENVGPPYIMVFLNWEKRPKRLDDDLCFFKQKYVIMIRATKENVQDFESYWGKPLQVGKQKVDKYGW